MNKNKLKGLATCLAAAWMLFACSNEETLHIASNVAVQFAGNIGGDTEDLSTQTRMADDQWQPSDCIGIYMVENAGMDLVLNTANRGYITQNTEGNFAPMSEENTIWFPVDETQKVDFIAYYPYNRSGSNISSVIDGFTYKANVLDQANPGHTDLLYAYSYENNTLGYDKNNPEVNLTFKHQMSKLVLKTIPGKGVDNLTGMTVTINGMYTFGDFDLKTATWDNLSDVDVISTYIRQEAKQYEAILIPATTATEGEWVVDFHLGGDTYTWKVPADTKLEQGMQHLWEISVQKVPIKVGGQILPWETGEGGKDIAQ